MYIDDPKYYNTIYSHNLQLDKLESFNHRRNAPGSVQVTGPHALHKIRRTVINPFFSKRQIVLLWPYILSEAEKLCPSLYDIADTSTVFLLTRAFGCFSLDVITEYAFGNCFNALDNLEISPHGANLSSDTHPSSSGIHERFSCMITKDYSTGSASIP